MIKQAIQRALFNWYMLIVLVIGILLLLPEFVNFIQSAAYDTETPFLSNTYNSFVATRNGISTLFVALLATLPASDSLIVDRESGFYQAVLTRTTYSRYLLSKIISTFLAGALAIGLPLTVLAILSYTVLPQGLEPELFRRVPPPNFLSTLYLQQSDLYILITLLNSFAYGGAFALLGLGLSVFLENRYLVLTTPFLLYHIANLVLQSLGYHNWAPPVAYTGVGSTVTAVSVYGVLLILLVVPLVILLFSRKEHMVFRNSSS